MLWEDKSTTKLRDVFDGSAKSNSKDLSVNDCLEKGTNVTHLRHSAEALNLHNWYSS